MVVFWVLICSQILSAQTITIRSVDAGPYSPGSTIAAAIKITDDNGKLDVYNNKYQLFISDANGSFTAERQIGEFSGFYTAFVNGTLPTDLAPGSSYKLRVKSTLPAVVSGQSSAFEVKAGNVVKAGTSSTTASANNAEVFGTCFADGPYTFLFINQSTPNADVTASFYNDLTQNTEQTISLATPTNFTAQNSNYTVLVKATQNGIIGTKAYLLTNNYISNSFQTKNSSSVCLPDQGYARVNYSVNITGDGGIQLNYPGTIYNIKWGDGTSTDLTYYQIVANNGVLTHDYLVSSCGATNAQGVVTNNFEVSFKVTNPYCPDQTKILSGNQAVLAPPKNIISAPQKACTGKEVTFNNVSFAGQVVSSTVGGGSCENPNALYQWYVNGIPVAPFNAPKNTPFKYTFPTAGTYTITLKLSSATPCIAPEATHVICVQDAPKASINVPSAVCVSNGAITLNNTSVVSNPCNNTITYLWKITPSTGYTYVDGTNENSLNPKILFSTAGNYTVQLSIDNGVCDIVQSTVSNINVSTAPTAVLSQDFSLCGKDHTLTFDDTDGSATKTTLTGTFDLKPDTYQWTVVGENGIAPATFVNNTNANSKYPQINFPDFGTYDITVKQINSCGDVAISQTQHITFKQAPTLTAGIDQTICFNDNVALQGNVTGTYNTLTWITNGTGTFSDNHAQKPIYTPSAADRAAGQVKLTLQISTSLPGDCASISDDVLIKINPSNTVTTAATKAICTTNSVNYNPASTVAGSTFTWTVTQHSNNITGFTQSGTGNIQDVLTNTSANATGTVTYTIVPHANNCDGTPFNFTVTVSPKPELTVTGPAGNSICSGSASGITLNANLSGTKYIWTVNVTGGITGAVAQTTPVSATSINQVLINNTYSPATVTYTITPLNSTSADNCDGDSKSVTITVQPQIPLANAGDDITLCDQSGYTLKGNDAGSFTGTWTLMTGQTGVTFADIHQAQTQVSGLQTGQVYTFRWTISNTSGCASQYDEVTVTNNPPVANNQIQLISPMTCAGQTILIKGSAPTGGNGNYAFVWERSTDGNNWISINNQTGQDLTIAVTESTYFRRSISSATCGDSKSNAIQALVQPPISNNTINSAQLSTCINTSAGTINGSTPQGADGNFLYQWQSSTDGGATWTDIAGATSVSYVTPVLSVNTQYRRLVSSVLCTGLQSNTSNFVSITVNPVAKAEFTWTKDANCIPFVINDQNIKAVAYPDRNATYTWYVNGQQFSTGIDFPAYTINNDGDVVEIKLVVTSKFGCESSTFSHTFTTLKNVTPSFTQTTTQNCGMVTVTFTNTSTNIANGTYLWNFGNGETSTKVQPDPVTFRASADGKDAVYNITLTASTPCSELSAASTVTIKPAVPIARVAPRKTSGCAPFDLVVDNISPGTNDIYTYHIVDANGQDVVTPVASVTRDAQTIRIPNEGNYYLYLEARNSCNIGKSSLVPITVTSRTLFAGLAASTTARVGCAPHTVNFTNSSQGGLNYRIEWNDGTPVTTTYNNGPLVHTFAQPGVYNVVLYASNDCAQNLASEIITITVTGKPVPAFNVDNGSGCGELKVNFTNNTPAPVNGQEGDLLYSWDFGDSKATAANPNTSTLRTPAAHTFSYAGSPYTVTLTVTNRTTGCSATTTRTITVNSPAIAEFRARPDSVQSYPNYQFAFEDLSTNKPIRWKWNFGDGSMSLSQNPSHTYADTGLYKVTLVAENQYCGSTKVHYVRIKGTPGQLFVPNAFTPASTNQQLNTFAAKGSGLKQWHMRIFNNYGQLIWETTKLDERGSPTDGWDGTFQGSPVPQGVYIWQIEAIFINGNEWKGMSYNSSNPKRTGAIHVIR